MSNTENANTWASPICVGWEEIGLHMRCSDEAARYRARIHDLPVYKPTGWNKPIAIKAELDAALLEIARHAQRLTWGKKVSETEG
ncbi:hypothetical protein [Bradyrhizobium sp. MOS002]|uniref:hypothetical protein n=1 Tax=Bradyrhizobium sp. MOS002 TaxID=2133947 RepID=UPI000D12F10D|nr:hypothetical protein [Bradyrhizobium sp. MOS002]PSO29840.1 hypothetical protein C7G41_24155 [Bradyrhizobium sp. MOS002]